ncbi:hypothetical protein SRB5_44170 [Streptomyces sp. RB5]|uniref:Polyketide cyclase n=1 Tax=Streptomyces smaragdinus TaxID=2585196 RepID=A0A7K0CNA8_9ACTN|nr:SRPBCC family protein [Streptomyces smaragdinus]MQY14254.1 hypothetical protein [Streptomyces smaragdinus]
MRYETELDVAVSPEKVWEVMADVDHWADFIPTTTWVRRESGDALAVGEKVRLKQPGIPVLVWQVTELEEGRVFVWQASAAGTRTVAGHEVTARGDGSHLRIWLEQSGPLAGPVGLLTGARTRRYVQTEIESMKARCEAG